MTTVVVAVSGLQRDIDIVWPLMADISQAFSPFGITLAAQPGSVLLADPETQSDGWNGLVKSLEAGSNFKTPAHLVATGLAPNADPTIDGQLCDPGRRGVVAIYLDSGIYGPQGPSQRTDLVMQVCAHELGHLLNLTHADGGDVGYPNTMLPAYQRQSQTPAAAWQAAITDAASRGEPMIAAPNPIHCYPFSAQSRANLREAAVNSAWLPFQSAFRGQADGAGGAQDRWLDIQVAPHGGEAATHVGGGLYFTLAIENRQGQPIELPLHIGPGHESLRVTVEHEDGHRTLHRPHRIFCSGARQTLLPGQRIHESFALTDRADSPLIVSPGRHVCRIELVDNHGPRRAQLGACKMALSAREHPAAASASRSLSRLLTPGSPRPRRLPALDEIGDGSALAWHMRLVQASRRSMDPAQRRLLEACQASDAPIALRHMAARRVVIDRMRRGENHRTLEAELGARFSNESDLSLILSVQRAADGLARRDRWRRL